MNGPEHFREAEKLLNHVSTMTVGGRGVSEGLAAAQVHATLALAAACVEDIDEGLRPGWVEIVGGQP